MTNPDLAAVEHAARAVNMILDSIYQRKRAPSPGEPTSDCCLATMERVGDEQYICSSCGRLCSDGTLSI